MVRPGMPIGVYRPDQLVDLHAWLTGRTDIAHGHSPIRPEASAEELDTPISATFQQLPLIGSCTRRR